MLGIIFPSAVPAQVRLPENILLLVRLQNKRYLLLKSFSVHRSPSFFIRKALDLSV